MDDITLEDDIAEDDDDYDDLEEEYEYDICYECSGYGDDYFINDDGELECRCPTCPCNISIDDN